MNKKPKGEIQIKNVENHIIDVINAGKKYTSRATIFTAIDDVNISITKGEFVAILGPSGSGKSTLLNILSGLDRPTHGEIVINGVNIAALTDSQLTRFRRDNVGFIFQSYNLLPTLNAKENAKIGQQLQTDKSKRLPIEQVFSDIGMDAHVNKRIDEISGGQQQRVSIARAISKNPILLFADEPTGALDENTAKKVLKIFLDLNEKYKTTIILVTHDKDIAKLAHKIIRVRNNKIQKHAKLITEVDKQKLSENSDYFLYLNSNESNLIDHYEIPIVSEKSIVIPNGIYPIEGSPITPETIYDENGYFQQNLNFPDLRLQIKEAQEIFTSRLQKILKFTRQGLIDLTSAALKNKFPNSTGNFEEFIDIEPVISAEIVSEINSKTYKFVENSLNSISKPVVYDEANGTSKNLLSLTFIAIPMSISIIPMALGKFKALSYFETPTFQGGQYSALLLRDPFSAEQDIFGRPYQLNEVGYSNDALVGKLKAPLEMSYLVDVSLDAINAYPTDEKELAQKKRAYIWVANDLGSQLGRRQELLRTALENLVSQIYLEVDHNNYYGFKQVVGSNNEPINQPNLVYAEDLF
ncbi:unnamed protein product [Didymodactylos carnosus]|uniref:ABC transporter domain-containing protein n=1 Tax=Didymodactylos carnosus TaxID=1234261 RepID=A0A8S2CNN0_9BILA|nr:unnamed protein product [Didymodactylos carnosus]CAF3499475.1 unnamed protein product [Didymodactylos carnosus]